MKHHHSSASSVTLLLTFAKTLRSALSSPIARPSLGNTSGDLKPFPNLSSCSPHVFRGSSFALHCTDSLPTTTQLPMMKLASSLVRTICSRQVHYQPSPTAHCFHSKSDQSSFLASTIYSVVKIFTISRTTNPLHPWSAPVSEEFTGSGFVVSGRRIITNAHVVTGATFVEVTKLKSGTKFKAKVLAFGHECDLAVLVIQDDGFWKDLEPLKLIGSMPNLLQTVHIVGYPLGGDSISITKGVISRINTDIYSHNRSQLQLPKLQVDAAINSGNSGGPVFVGSEVIGVAFESLSDGENIGYVIPSPILKLFLASIEKGKEAGFCSLGMTLQAMENPMMRSYFKMKMNMTGVLVTSIGVLSHATDYVKKNDVILEVDGIPVEDDGNVFFEKKFWIHLNGFVALRKPNEQIFLKVLRMGEVRNINVVVMPIDSWYTTDYPSPNYFIFAGFVFTECIYGGVKISQVLEGNINKGYTSFGDLEVCCANGKIINSLEQLYESIAASTKYVRIELESSLVVIVNIDTHKKSHGGLLERHGVMFDMSEDIEQTSLYLGKK